jgi:3-oxoacyl-[acyl-carrier protein] reductase
MLLANQTAIVYDGPDSIGSTVARGSAREGAHVHLAGCTEATLEEVAQRIRNDGGIAHVATLDALDRNAVDRHAALVAAAGGGIDLCFNARGVPKSVRTPRKP